MELSGSFNFITFASHSIKTEIMILRDQVKGLVERRDALRGYL